MASQPIYDVIVVGSGAAGGISAYVLATQGLKVLCLEAGRMLDPAQDFFPHKMSYDWPHRGDGKPGQYGDLPEGMDWKIKEWTDHLYTIPNEDPYALAPGAEFTWTRLRAVGGRTNLWGREILRFGPLDFKAKSLQDGWGDDWPVSYEDISPYYDRVESLIGVSNGSEEVYNTPIGKSLLPPFRPRCAELLVKRGAAKLGIKAVHKPLAVLSRSYDGRPACHYCGACSYGCDTKSRYCAAEVLIPKLTTLPNFTLRTHSVVHTVLMDGATGKARGVTYVDANNRQEYEVYAKAVVLAPSMVESIRILFNSRNRNQPQGLANSSGMLGKYIMDHVSFESINGFFPQLAGKPTTNDDGPGEAIVYIPRYNYGHRDRKNYLRGWVLHFFGGCDAGPGVGASRPGFGSAYKKQIKELYPAGISMTAYGEGLALPTNYVEIDPGGLRDPWGIPQVRFHADARYPHAMAILEEIYGQIDEVLRASGAEILPFHKRGPKPLGGVTHEAGGCRMGDDPRLSVLDKWNRCHDVKNLLVVDASCFVSHPEKSITHTIMAISYRASDHLAEEFRSGNV
jgi:choline dehydrogenase-like flavoprotein